MNRKILVSLLRKNIEELEIITEGFMEMNEYPLVIIKLARRKTEDIQSIIDQLIEINIVKSDVELNFKPDEVKIIDKDVLVVSEKPLQVEPEIKTTTEEEKPEFNVSIPVVNHVPEINAEITEKENEPVEEPENAQPDSTTVEPIPLQKSKIETIELETLVQDALNKTKSSADFGFKEDEDEELMAVNTEDEIKLAFKIKEDEKIAEITKEQANILKNEEIEIPTIAKKNISTTISRNDKLSKSDNSFSASLANKKIDDIKQAISIGDRFRFQRELFNGNGEEMNKTLHYINQLASYEEAVSFLATKYKWDIENVTADDFNQIVKRKFN